MQGPITETKGVLMKKLARFLKKFSIKRKRDLESRRFVREDKKHLRESTFKELGGILLKKRVSLTVEQKKIIGTLSPGALNKICSELRLVESKKKFLIILEACIAYFKRVRSGERPQSLGSGSDLSGYVIEYIREKELLR